MKEKLKPAFMILACGFCLTLSGCSLLFVAQGKTGVSTTPPGKIPRAASMEKRMGSPVVVKYRVEKGDTLPFLAEAYYGKPNAAEKILRENPRFRRHGMKPGNLVRIVNPDYFPSKDELKKKREKLLKPSKPATPSLTPDPSLAFSTADTDADEKDVTPVRRPRVNRAFAPGEKLTYQVRALSMIAGFASLEVGNYVTLDGRPCYPLIARANAAFPFSTFYAVKDVQTSYFDAVDFLTWKFENDVSEGRYKARNLELYRQLDHRMVRRHNDEKPEEMDIPAYDQDIISCFYYFRLLPLKVGVKYAIPTTSAGKNYKLIVKVVGREKITTAAGTFDCFRLKPFVKYETVFRNSENIDLWVTADERHIPVLIKSAILIGSIEISLLEATLPEMRQAKR